MNWRTLQLRSWWLSDLIAGRQAICQNWLIFDNECRQPVAHKGPKVVAARVARGSDTQARGFVMAKDRFGAAGQLDHPGTRKFGIEENAGFFPNGNGDGAGHDGCSRG